MRSPALIAFLLLPLSTFAAPIDASSNRLLKTGRSLAPAVNIVEEANKSPLLPRASPPRYDPAAGGSSELSNVNHSPLSHGQYDPRLNPGAEAYGTPKKLGRPEGFWHEYYGKQVKKPGRPKVYEGIGKSPLGN